MKFAKTIQLKLVPFAAIVLGVFITILIQRGDSAQADDKDRVVSGNAEYTKTIKPFLATYCYECHGEKKQKGERRFDALAAVISDDESFVDFQDILDQLNLAEMPPQKAKQPSVEQRRQVIQWLTKKIERYHQSREVVSGETVLRRLNSREYENTIRDLLHLNTTIFRPAEFFPRDQTTEHLDNVGASLVTSGYLLSRYLDSADRIIEKSLYPLKRPAVRKWTFRDDLRQQPEIDQVHVKTHGHSHLTLYDVIGADKPEGAYAPIHAFKKGVPVDGFYTIRFKAKALNRDHPYDTRLVGTDKGEPLRLGIVAGSYLAGDLYKTQPIEPVLAELDLADGEDSYEVRVWLDAGYTPRFTFQNGLMDVRSLWGRLVSRYKDQFPKRTRPGIVENRFYAIKYGKLPQIQVDDIEIEGPFFDTWPKLSQTELLGRDAQQILNAGDISDEQIRSGATAFASRAYRRPATAGEIERVLAVVKQRKLAGRSSIDAYGDGLKVVLCSPNFLYLDTSGEERLSAHALASRLSYFLWSSMPDRQLIDLADQNQLLQSEVLSAEVERMLNDPKSAALVNDFLDSWLMLRELGATPPDRDAFGIYYHYDLKQAMLQETRMFTRHLLEENLSVVNFLDSDFTFVNKRLAKLYSLPTVDGYNFRFVKLEDRRRGGLLGQASVLTVSANGIDTSPVVRGVWMLDNVLGTPASPPPPDVEPLDPDIRGAKTIREQLAKHRSVASCNDCHRKIDPMGFALENFDPIGRWRETYGRNSKIETAGELPSGESFKDVVGLKEILVQRKEVFVRALSSKLLTYSLGRRLERSDRPQIEKIAAELAERNYGFRELVKLVVANELFQRP